MTKLFWKQLCLILTVTGVLEVWKPLQIFKTFFFFPGSQLLFGLELRALYLCSIMQKGWKNNKSRYFFESRDTGCYSHGQLLKSVVGPFFCFIQANLLECLHLLHFIFWDTACFWSVFWLSGNTLTTLKWCICLAPKCCWWRVLHLPSSTLVTLTDSGVNLVGFLSFCLVWWQRKFPPSRYCFWLFCPAPRLAALSGRVALALPPIVYLCCGNWGYCK